MKLKLAYIGGGSLFVPSIVNGIGQMLQKSSGAFEVELCLYDIQEEKALRMGEYGQIVAQAWDVPLSTTVAKAREKALDGADIVIVSAWLQKEHEQIERLWAQMGFQMPEEGPAVAAWAKACAPWTLQIAEEMEQYCPEGLFITLMNPTDVLAGLVVEAAQRRSAKIRAAGLCVEVDGLRGALSYYFKVPFESIELVHAGVNHDGWVLNMKVDRQDGYDLWRDCWQQIEADPDYHPGNRGIAQFLRLTGHLRSSGYHTWPYQVDTTPAEKALWEKWRGKRELYEQTIRQAIETGQPVSNPPGIHPERSKLNYPYTGLTVGKLLQSIATGEASTLPLQVINHGAVANFPEQAVVEVPVRVQGRELEPQKVGEMPDWLGGYTRLLATQRRMFVEYLLNHDLATLKQALAVLPVFGSVQQMNGYAEALHGWG